jgi:hypothetical protein
MALTSAAMINVSYALLIVSCHLGHLHALAQLNGQLNGAACCHEHTDVWLGTQFIEEDQNIAS